MKKHWGNPIIKTKGGGITLGVIFMALSIAAFHDAYEVRGHDRPFILKIIGFPQL